MMKMGREKKRRSRTVGAERRTFEQGIETEGGEWETKEKSRCMGKGKKVAKEKKRMEDDDDEKKKMKDDE